jgi:hypothetical protein
MSIIISNLGQSEATKTTRTDDQQSFEALPQNDAEKMHQSSMMTTKTGKEKHED